MELRNYRLGLCLCTSLDWHHLPSICHTPFTYPTVVKPSWCLPVMCNPLQTHMQLISSGLDLIMRLLFRFYLPVNKKLEVTYSIGRELPPVLLSLLGLQEHWRALERQSQKYCICFQARSTSTCSLDSICQMLWLELLLEELWFSSILSKIFQSKVLEIDLQQGRNMAYGHMQDCTRSLLCFWLWL